MRFVPLGLLALLCACTTGIVPMYENSCCGDYDGDGWSVSDGDCDDGDASINPSATEVCDGLDNDCDGEIDNVDDNLWFYDEDGDGWGSDIGVVNGCELESEGPGQWVEVTGDCDDGDSAINPGATEVCDGIDNDCDGESDEDDALDATLWFVDEDGDGWGDVEEYTLACDQPDGYVIYATDCNDHNPLVNPGQAEICDELDNDCDGVTDPDSSADASTWYDDADGDGWGDSSSSNVSCSAPSGTVADATDCDDTDSSVNPDAIEVCWDTVDNDCDGNTDSSPCVAQGDYEGDFVVEVTETTGYSLGSDSCEGTANLTVDITASPMISGTVECAFAGGFATFFPDTYTGDVEGDFDTDLLPSGSIEFSSFGWSTAWEDDGSSDTTLDGIFDGSDTYVFLTFDYEGDFETYYYTP